MPKFNQGFGLGLEGSLLTESYRFVNAEAAALVARFTTQPTNARKSLIDTVVGALKTAGVWTKLDALYVMAALDAQAAQRNWIADLYNLTAIASPTFTVDRGYQSDGVSSYLTTGFNPSTAPSPKFTQNSASFGFWSRTNLASVSAAEMGNSNSVILPRNTTDQSLYRVNNSGTASGTPASAVTDSREYFAALRAASGQERIRRNTASLNISVNTSTPIANSPFIVGGRNTDFAGGYALGNASTRQIAMSFIGANLTDGESDSFYTASNTLLTAIGAA
jgi:hypothetical protein